jgi:hypothetical protein
MLTTNVMCVKYALKLGEGKEGRAETVFCKCFVKEIKPR